MSGLSLGLGLGLSRSQGVGVLGNSEYVAIALIGQSNMASNNYPASINPAIDTTDARILQWSTDGSGDPAKAGTLLLAEDVLLFPGVAPTRGVGPGMFLAKAVLPYLAAHQKIVLLPLAVGGTGSVAWLPPSGASYVIARNAIVAFLDANPTATVQLIADVQGEADIVAGTSEATYIASKAATVAALRACHSRVRSDAPFLSGGILIRNIVTSGAAGTAIKNGHRKMPLTVPNAYYTADVNPQTESDALHYAAAPLRAMGTQLGSRFLRARANTASPPAIPTGVQMDGRALRLLGSDAPAYVISTSAPGAGVFTETVVYPYAFGDVGTEFKFFLPSGIDAKDVKVRARSIAGDSADTSVIQYAAPASTVPQAYWDLDIVNAPFDGSDNITSMPSVGSNTTAWTPVGTVKRSLLNGIAALDVSAAGVGQLKKTGTLPTGSYTHLFAGYYAAALDPNDSLLLGPGDGGNNGPTVLSAWPLIAHQTPVAQLQAVNAYYDGPYARHRAATYQSFAFTWDASTLMGRIYRNGVLVAEGSVPLQVNTAAVQRLFGRSSDAVNQGARGVYMKVSAWTSVLTQDQINTVLAGVATTYSVPTWGYLAP